MNYAVAVVLCLTALACTAADAPPTDLQLAPPALIRGVMNGDLKVLQELGANSCLLWGPPGKPEVWEAYKKAGQFVFLNSLSSMPKEFFEFEGKKRTKLLVPFCYSGKFGQWWIRHVEEAAPKRLPAIHNLSTDEWAWMNGHIPYQFGIRQPVGTKFYCDCGDCRNAVAQFPEVTASRFLQATDASRRFIEYRYQTTASVLKMALEKAQAGDAQFLSYCCMNLREVMALERYPYGIALDMLPPVDILMATVFQTNLDQRGELTRYLQPLVVKHLLAAKPKAGVLPVIAATVYDYEQKFDWTEAYYWRKEIEALLPEGIREVVRKQLSLKTLESHEVILPALASLASGSRGAMYFGEDKKDELKKLFALMARIERRLAGAAVPPEIVVLCSRRTEDARMLKEAKPDSRNDLSDAMLQAGCWAQPSNLLAWLNNDGAPHAASLQLTHNTLIALMRLNVPFRLHFVENLERADLQQARLIIVPECTHLSDDKAALITAAAQKARVVTLAHAKDDDSDAGLYDENGKARATPALGGVLKPLLERTQQRYPSREQLQQKLSEALTQVRLSVEASCQAADVEWTWLDTSDGGVAFFAFNYSSQAAEIKLKLPGNKDAMRFELGGIESAVKRKSKVTLPPHSAVIVVQ